MLGKTALRRAVQYCGDAGDADVVGIEGLFLEVKRVEKLNVPQALAKAVEQAGGDLPLLVHRKNRGEWLVTLRMSDLVHLSQLVTKESHGQAESGAVRRLPVGMSDMPQTQLPDVQAGGDSQGGEVQKRRRVSSHLRRTR